jgi:AmiR/NasT family two-component response regulator
LVIKTNLKLISNGVCVKPIRTTRLRKSLDLKLKAISRAQKSKARLASTEASLHRSRSEVEGISREKEWLAKEHERSARGDLRDHRTKRILAVSGRLLLRGRLVKKGFKGKPVGK